MKRPVATLVAGALLVGAAGCGVAVDELSSRSAGALDDRTRFCLTLARMATAIEAGSPQPAGEAAEELLAQSDAELQGDVRDVVEALRAALDRGGSWAVDGELSHAVEHLGRRTEGRCP